MRVIVLLNAKAGATPDPSPEMVREALSRAGIDADVRAVEGEKLIEAAKTALAERPDAIFAGGGDGTISAVAGVLAGGETPLGVLPLGTLNHFAKDLGMPLTLDEAAAALASGAVRAVDVAEANGRTFLNNASIGLYPRIVRRRDADRQRLGRGKWMAMLVAFLSVWRRFPLVHVRIRMGDDEFRCDTPFVFIGNNEYPMQLLSFGSRPRLDAGVLSVYFAHRGGRFAMLWMALRALVSRLNQSKDFESRTLGEFTIESRKKKLHMAFDGEVFDVVPPLNFRSRPGALRVIAPTFKGEPR